MKIYTDFPLSNILYYKIGGPAKVILEVHSRKDLEDALEYIKVHSIEKVMPIGIGSNILMNDSGFDGAIIWFSKNGEDSIILKENNQIEVFSASLLDDVIRFSFEHNVTGLEWAGGLPSTVGGAIRGNVGAFGSEIKESVVSVDIIDFKSPELQVQTFLNNDLEFSYRSSIVKKNKNLLVVSAVFQLKSASDEELRIAKSEYYDHIEYRKKNHAVEYPSCGSVFKNITEKEKVEKILAKWPDIKDQVEGKWHGKVAMGYINKRLGFSGFTVGGAQVSEKHSNYIINKKNASYSDVLTIIHAIQHRFQSEFRFKPEPEVEIVQ